MELKDLKSIDVVTANTLTDLKKSSKEYSDEDFGYAVDENFETILTNGDTV